MSAGPWFADHPEFVPEWDVARNDDGTPITITPAQAHAVEHALLVLKRVEESEGSDGCGGLYQKSRLLGRMLYEGLPPTRTKPPYNMGAPWWGDLPGGDPFLTEDEKAERAAEQERLNNIPFEFLDQNLVEFINGEWRKRDSASDA